jgi:hypothetical protein
VSGQRLTNELVRKLRPAVRGVVASIVRAPHIDDAEQAAWEALTVALPNWRGLDEEPAETKQRLADGDEATRGKEMGSLVNFAREVARRAALRFTSKESRGGVRYARKGALHAVSLDAPVRMDDVANADDMTGAELLPDPNESALDRLIRIETEESVRASVALLPNEEREVARRWSESPRAVIAPATDDDTAPPTDARARTRFRTARALRAALGRSRRDVRGASLDCARRVSSSAWTSPVRER